MANDNIKIPDRHYVGMMKREDDQLPLGFITPWGEDSAAAKRMATVDSWAGYNSSNQGHYQKSIKPIVIENTPLVGFKLSGSIRTSNYGGDNKWRIIDPRGFELEVTSGNLAKLLSVSVFDQGEIMDQCVWGRQGANNILLSISTDEYKQATENTKVSKERATWSDVKLGDIVVLQNNVRGVYLGRQFMFYKDYNRSEVSGAGDNEFTSSSKSVYVIHNPDHRLYDYTQELHLLASPKLSSIVKAEKELPSAEAELLANEILHDERTQLTRSGYKTVVALTFNSINPTKDYILTKVAKNIASSGDLTLQIKYPKEDAIFVEINGNYYAGISNHYSQKFQASLYSVDHLTLNEFRAFYVHATDSNNCRWYHNNRTYLTNTLDYEYKPTDKFFNIELCIKTKNGNEFKQFI
jgi:hypothetical protein